jgi:hypothetical protein
MLSEAGCGWAAPVEAGQQMVEVGGGGCLVERPDRGVVALFEGQYLGGEVSRSAKLPGMGSLHSRWRSSLNLVEPEGTLASLTFAAAVESAAAPGPPGWSH